MANRCFTLNHKERWHNKLDNYALPLQNNSMWIARKYEDTLNAMVSQFPSVVVTGPRQSGKTSLVRHAFPDFDYVTLDIPAAAAQAESNPDEFFREHSLPLIVDEVQYAPSLFRHIKTIIDEDRQAGRIILTGSQVFPLMQGVSESLAGRCGILSLMNLSVAELRSAKEHFDEPEFLFKGGYPELHASPEVEPYLWYGAYLAAYLERDVRNILNVGSLRDFNRFLRAVATRTGQILSYSDLARDVGIAPNTAKNWISVLQASGQIILLEPYYGNIGKRLIKSPKLYLNDTGLAIFLMGFESWEAVARHPVAGAVWETHVVIESLKKFSAEGRRIPMWFWRTTSGEEVDLIIERDGLFTIIECKIKELVDKSDLKGIRAFTKEYGADRVRHAYIASGTRRSYPVKDHVSAIPGSYIAEYI